MGYLNKKKVLKLAKGFRGRRKNCYRLAFRAVQNSLLKAYVGRKEKKRYNRREWIAKVNAGARLHGIMYSRFIYGLNQSSIKLNRKMLSELAENEPVSFGCVADCIKELINLKQSPVRSDGYIGSVHLKDFRATAAQNKVIQEIKSGESQRKETNDTLFSI